MNKKKTSHQKSLNERRIKKTVQGAKFRPQSFSLWDFVMTYQMEFLVALILIAIVVFIPRWDSLRGKKETVPVGTTLSEDMKQQLLSQYPNGFKLIEVRNWKVTLLDDTLSPRFRVNWRDIQVTRMNVEGIRIKLPNVYHEPTNLVLKNPTVDFQRHHQEILRVNQSTGIILLAQIIEDTSDRVLCLFSFELAN